MVNPMSANNTSGFVAHKAQQAPTATHTPRVRHAEGTLIRQCRRARLSQVARVSQAVVARNQGRARGQAAKVIRGVMVPNTHRKLAAVVTVHTKAQACGTPGRT